MRIKFYITRLPHSEGIPLPKYQTDGSAGVDLPAAIENSANIQPGARLLVPTGFAFSMPAAYEAQVRPRSAGLSWQQGSADASSKVRFRIFSWLDVLAPFRPTLDPMPIFLPSPSIL